MDKKALEDLKNHAATRMRAAVENIADLPDEFMDQADIWKHVAMQALAAMMAAITADSEARAGRQLSVVEVQGITSVVMEMMTRSVVASIGVGHGMLVAHRSAPQ